MIDLAEEIYPATIIHDRYNGTYSGGKWTAWNKHFEDVPEDINGDDMTCFNFWADYKGVVGKGNTPNTALIDLKRKLNGT